MVEMLILKIMLNCLLRSIMIHVRYAWVSNSCVPVNHSKWQNRSVVECSHGPGLGFVVGWFVGLGFFGYLFLFFFSFKCT